METGKILSMKLKTLATSASMAGAEIEKAAIFAASQSILQYFRNGDDEKWNSYTKQKVETAVWHIAAAVGYAPDNGHNRSQHVSWAYSAVDSLMHLLGTGQSTEP